MVATPATDGFTDLVVEQMAGFAAVRVRRMFGGLGIYHDGLMFALVMDGVVYFKGDALTRDDFDAEGLEAFSYASRGGRTTIMSFRRAPERCLEDTEAMVAWCRKAYGAALRASKPKRKMRPAAKP